MKKIFSILFLLSICLVTFSQTPFKSGIDVKGTANLHDTTKVNKLKFADGSVQTTAGGGGVVTLNDNILHWNGGYNYYTPFQAYQSNAFYWNGSVLDFGGPNNSKLFGSRDTAYWNLPLTRKIKASDTARWAVNASDTAKVIKNKLAEDSTINIDYTGSNVMANIINRSIGTVFSIDNRSIGIGFNIINRDNGYPWTVLDNSGNPLSTMDRYGNIRHGSSTETDSILATRGYVKNNSIRANATTTLTGNTAIIVPATEHPFYVMAASKTPAAGIETYVYTDSSFWSRIAGGKNKQSNSYNTIVSDRTNIKLNSNGVNKSTTVILDSIGLRYTQRNTEPHHYVSSPFGIPDKYYVDSLKNSIVTTDSTGILNNIYGKITPFATQLAGAFDNSSTNPIHTNRLNYDGYLYTSGLFAYGTTNGIYGDVSDPSGAALNAYSSNGGWLFSGDMAGVGSAHNLLLLRRLSSTGNATGDLISVLDNPTTVGTKSGSILKATIGSTERLRLDPRVKGNADSTAYVFDTDRQLLATDTLFNIKNHGSGKFKVLYNGDLILSGNIKNPQYTGSLTDDTPTSSEITSIVGSASTKGSGFKAVIKDSNGTGLLYIVESDGTYWYYTVMTKAL